MVQNWAAKLVLSKRKANSSKQALISLHWLLVKFRIQFKILLLIKKCLSGEAPNYLKDLLCYSYRKFVQRHGQKLIIPYVKNSTFAYRSFSVMGPRLWNELPTEIRSELNIDVFKKSLKTYLFRRAFNMDSDFVYY